MPPVGTVRGVASMATRKKHFRAERSPVSLHLAAAGSRLQAGKGLLAAFVMLLVIEPVIPALDAPHPGAVVPVPLNCPGEAGCEIDARRPAQLPLHLFAAKRVPPVVARPVCYGLQQAFGLAGETQDL